MERKIRWYDYITINIFYFALTARSQPALTLTPLTAEEPVLPLLHLSTQLPYGLRCLSPLKARPMATSGDTVGFDDRRCVIIQGLVLGCCQRRGLR